MKSGLLIVLMLLALPVHAQQLRALRVPEGAEVVIPPRGVGQLPAPRTTTRARLTAADAWPDEDVKGPSAWTYVLIPLAAGAIAALASNLPGGGGSGGGGGSSGPVRTR